MLSRTKNRCFTTDWFYHFESTPFQNWHKNRNTRKPCLKNAECFFQIHSFLFRSKYLKIGLKCRNSAVHKIEDSQVIFGNQIVVFLKNNFKNSGSCRSLLVGFYNFVLWIFKDLLLCCTVSWSQSEIMSSLPNSMSTNLVVTVISSWTSKLHICWVQALTSIINQYTRIK